MVYTGKVFKQIAGHGTKNEHVALMLHTRGGAKYMLRRKGENALEEDKVLGEFVGKDIVVDGVTAGNGTILIAVTWKPLA